jgi:hypothetical protein
MTISPIKLQTESRTMSPKAWACLWWTILDRVDGVMQSEEADCHRAAFQELYLIHGEIKGEKREAFYF